MCRVAAKCAFESETSVLSMSTARSKMLRSYADGKTPGAGSDKKAKRKKGSKNVPEFSISLTHEMCSFGLADSLHDNLKCSFKSQKDIKQLIILRYDSIIYIIY
jgi:hypothetical protein